MTVTLDLGQGGELTDVRERALAAGAVRAHVIDAREEFVRDFILPALQAGALDDGRYPLASGARSRARREAPGRRGADGVGVDASPSDRRPRRLPSRALDPLADPCAVDCHRTMLAAPTMPPPVRVDDANLWGRSRARRPDEAWSSRRTACTR